MNEQGNPSEDPRPQDFRPQSMPRAEEIEMEPLIREQALPEKDDDRFFDRWAVDKAHDLGARVVKRSGLEKLKEAIRGFAEWRSLRHAPAAERASMDDRVTVASTPERIETARAEASEMTRKAEEAERRAGKCEREIEDAEDRVSTLRPALRGTDWDILLTLLANLVVFAVDLFVIHVALGRIPGDDQEYWLTAGTMGAGAVVVGDALGWMAAVGSVRRDGGLRRPGGLTIGSVTGVLLVAVWFFVQLSDFRKFGLNAFAEHEHVKLGDPAFFLTAQILFLVASAVVCFAYVARGSGREARKQRRDLESERDDLHEDVMAFGARAERARRNVAEAPALRKAAEERIRARERIAAGDAAHDLKQGQYLESLVEPEYMRERADVESGLTQWRFGEGEELAATLGLLIGVAAVATAGAAALAFWLMESVAAVVFTGVIVAAAFAVYIFAGDGPGRARRSGGNDWRYVARLFASARRTDERATEIEDLAPFRPTAAEDGSTDGGQNGAANGKASQRTRAELVGIVEKIRQALDG